MEFDDILKHYLGEIGLYQVLLLLFAASAGVNSAFNLLDYTFIGSVPKFQCNVGNTSHLQTNLSHSQLLSLISPKLEDGKIDSCSMYNSSYSMLSISDALNKLNEVNRTDEIIPCSRWTYQEIGSTVTSQFDMVCDREWLIATSQSIYMSGMFSVVIFGWLSDRFGRRHLALSMMCLCIFARIGQGLAVNYAMFVVFRFFLGIGSINWYTAIFFISIEMVGPKWRVLAGQSPYLFWSIGYVILAFMAFLIRDWRTLTLTFVAFTIPYLLHFWFLPESVRWLQAVGKVKEAIKTINQIARINKKPPPPEHLITRPKGKIIEKDKLSDLLKSPKQIVVIIILILQWITLSFVYYGLVFYLPNLGGNIYMNTAISGALEIPALLYVQFTLDTRLGRRFNTILTFIVSGLAIIALMFIPTDLTSLIITLALLGRISITAAFSLMYIFTAELFPTSQRSLGVSICSTMSRIGGILAPYITLTSKLSPYMPPFLMGVMAFMSGLLGLLLPETKGVNLPETFTKQVLKEEECNEEDMMLEKHISNGDQKLHADDKEHKFLNNNNTKCV